jgi:hypothetical protein
MGDNLVRGVRRRIRSAHYRRIRHEENAGGGEAVKANQAHTFHWDAAPFVTMSKTIKVNMMPRTRPSLKLLSLCLLGCASLASAQQTQAPPPSDKPPKLERIEPGSDVPATTIPPKGGTQIKEKKQGGQVTEVEVQAGPSHYTMRPNTPAGNAQAGTVESGITVSTPQWKVLEFDLNRKRKQGEAGSGETADQTPAAADVPPPPRPAGKK